MTVFGYARVSTEDQDLAIQLEALKAAHCSKIFREKVSGARAFRPQLAKLMEAVKQGDVVVVAKLDRFGRSTRELLNLIHELTERGCGFRSIGDPLFDTTSSQGQLMLQILAAIAQYERALIKERTSAGRARAKAAGVKFGRKRKLSDFQRAEAMKRRDAGETLTSIAKSYAVSPAMISRMSP